MDTQLTELLKNAHTVCTYAYENFFDQADGMKADAEANYYRHKGFVKALSWIIGFTVYFIGAMIVEEYSDAVFVVFGFAIASGILAYYLGFIPKVKERYYAAVSKADEVKSQGFNYLSEHIEEINIIPDEYWFPKATDYLYRIARDGRVDNINQALAMLDDQLHRWKIENANSQMLAEQQRQSATLKQIRIDTALNAVINAMRR